MISDNYQINKLKKYNINIKTKYIVGSKILERNTDNSINDDIKSGIRCEKEYYINNILKHTEKCFDSRIEYTYVSEEEINKEYVCPNCGMKAKLKEFSNGCPYCKTPYNIEYTDKELGNKYHYDRVLRSNLYRIITAIVDIIISIILSFIFIKMTSRTFNNYDVIKIFIYGGILALVLYYLFYIMDAYVILTPIKLYKDKQNQKQVIFWNNTKMDKKKFFNNLNYEIGKHYYSKDNIIDYDILDYISFEFFEKDNTKYVKVKLDMRLIFIDRNTIKSKYIKDTVLMRKNENEVLTINGGANVIKCHNCGSSIEVDSDKCKYCGTPVKYLQEWILEDNTYE